MKSNPTKFCKRYLLACLGLVSVAACQQQHEPRVYTAPKQESVFVVQPPKMPGAPGLASSGGLGMPGMRASSIPMEQKRILGAVFPYLGYGYFLKITDTISRIDAAAGNFADVVAKFTVDPQTFQPNFDLPAGWQLAPGDSIADAKIEISVARDEKPVVITVTKLNAPSSESEWRVYLKEQLDRWNGQVGLGEQSVDEWESQLARVDRPESAIPAYIFDRDGSHTSSGSIPKGEGASAGAASGSGAPTAASSGGGMPASSSGAPPRLQYETPEGWIAQPGSPYRMASFRIGSEDSDTEVAVSQALDVPLENCKMWAQQVTKSSETEINDRLAEKAVADAELIPAGDKQARVYRLAASDEPDANCLVIASIPVNDQGLSIFVKLRSSVQTAQDQNENLLRFIHSLRWE
ncbi:hypothetical protein SH449x_001998 [Pirellulaceae bacterium SH449]